MNVALRRDRIAREEVHAGMDWFDPRRAGGAAGGGDARARERPPSLKKKDAREEDRTLLTQLALSLGLEENLFQTTRLLSERRIRRRRRRRTGGEKSFCIARY